MDMDDAGRDALRQLVQLTTTTLTIAQQIHHRRADTARDEQHQHDAAARDMQHRLTASRTAHQDQWDRIARHGYASAASNRELVEQWTTAATWEHRDPTAARARPVLDQQLTRAGIPHDQLDAVRTGPDFATAAATLTERVDHDHSDERDKDGNPINTDRTSPDNNPGVQSTSSHREQNVYAHGAAPARTAGAAYPETTEQAVAQAAQRHRSQPSSGRAPAPDRSSDRGRGR